MPDYDYDRERQWRRQGEDMGWRDRDYDYGRYGNQYGNEQDRIGAYGYGRATAQSRYGDQWQWGQDEPRYGANYPRYNADYLQTGYRGRPYGTEWGEGYQEPRYAGQGGYGAGGGEQGRHWHGYTQARGYQRSDQRIRDDVYDRLMDHPGIDTSDTDVQVNNGEVTLSGTVDDRWEKRMAEDICDSVPGVRDVHNQLRVTQGQHMQGTGMGRTMTGGMMTGTMAGGMVSRDRVRDGMDVIGTDGERVGQVKDIRDNDFVLDRSGSRDLRVPFSAIQTVRENQVVLSVPSDQVDNMNWPTTDLLGSPSGTSSS